MARWAQRNQKKPLPLLVVHSHGHGDHVAGDKGFEGMAGVTLIPANVEAEQKAFGAESAIDLGDRTIDVIPIPGHHAAHVAYYDRRTGILLTGDHLYPGRLYVTDFAAYVASTRKPTSSRRRRPMWIIRWGRCISRTSIRTPDVAPAN